MNEEEDLEREYLNFKNKIKNYESDCRTMCVIICLNSSRSNCRNNIE